MLESKASGVARAGLGEHRDKAGRSLPCLKAALDIELDRSTLDGHIIIRIDRVRILIDSAAGGNSTSEGAFSLAYSIVCENKFGQFGAGPDTNGVTSFPGEGPAVIGENL